jgi:uncharacterized protein YacL
MNNEQEEKINMGCLSVFWTGLKGFTFLVIFFAAIAITLLICLLLLVFYLNFLATAPLPITLIVMAITAIFVIGYYGKWFQWSVKENEKYERENG